MRRRLDGALPPPDSVTPAYDTLLNLARSRRSAYAYSDAPVTDDELAHVLEVARHAPSSYNEQPWRVVVARRGEAAYDAIYGALKGQNPGWASTAPALGLTLASPTFSRTGKPNRHAWHDVGAFVAMLSLAADALGLSVHQMAGVDGPVAAGALDVPDLFEVVAAFALGHPAATRGAGLPDELATRARTDKPRRPVEETAFGPTWGESLGSTSP